MIGFYWHTLSHRMLQPYTTATVNVSSNLPSNHCALIPVAQKGALWRGVDFVVGTPGRVLDHIEHGNLLLDKCRFLVLDEGKGAVFPTAFHVPAP